MRCTDAALRDRLLEAPEPESRALEDHVRACAHCRGAFAALGAAEVHPSGLALADFDEEREALAPAVRAWIARHLDKCRACAEALGAVPAEAPAAAREARGWDATAGEGPSRARAAIRGRRLAWPLVAAAGWLLAAFVAFDRGAEAPAGREPESRAVLGAERSAGETVLPSAGDRVALSLVLADDLAPGTTLHFTVVTPSGVRSAPRPLAVQGEDEWGWPIVRLRRSELPRGSFALEVRTPSGTTATFALVNP